MTVGVPTDCLPYSAAIERVRDTASALAQRPLTCREIWHILLRLRKRGALPRLVRN
jgi:hypothetical protein